MSFSQNPIGTKLLVLAAFVISGSISISGVAAVVSTVVGTDQSSLIGLEDIEYSNKISNESKRYDRLGLIY